MQVLCGMGMRVRQTVVPNSAQGCMVCRSLVVQVPEHLLRVHVEVARAASATVPETAIAFRTASPWQAASWRMKAWTAPAG